MRKQSMQALVTVAGGLIVLSAQVHGQALTPCTSNCAAVSVEGGSVAQGETLNLPVSFTQAPDDGEDNQGNDNVAAIAMTVGLGPANGPLSLADCADGNSDGVPDSVVPGAAIEENFKVVVENAYCTNRNRCLCPDGSQMRDNFVNLVVYGPKELPPTGPVNIPRLPDADPLVTIGVRATGTSASPVPIEVFAETGTNPKPQFGAFLSIGDQAAIDQTANRGTNTSKVTVAGAEVTIEGGTGSCAGDCNDSGAVEIGELVIGVNMILETAPVSACPEFDTDSSKSISIGELVEGVNNALEDCP